MPDAPARVLGPFSTTSIVIGAIIGVGIFFTPQKVAAITASPSLLMIAWAVGGLIALCGALAFAELGGMYTGAAAQYNIIRDATGRLPAFLFVFCNATAIQAGVIGIIAIICAQNIAVAAGAPPLSGPALISACLALIAVVAAANIIGVRSGAAVQNFTVAAKLLTLLAITALAFLLPRAAGVPPVIAPATTAPNPTTAILLALIPIMFTYGGWQQALWISGEVKDPAKNLPRSIIIGVLIVIAVYLLANAAYLRLLGIDGMAQAKTLAADAVAQVLPGTGRRIVAGAVALSAFGILNAQLLSGPRLIHGMAAARQFFAPFGRLHPRLGTPIPAILLLTLTGVTLFLLAALSTSALDALDYLINGVMFIDVSFFALTGLALIILRTKRPDAPRPVRVPGYPVVPLLFVAGELGALVGFLFNPAMLTAAFIGAAWIAGAAIVYFLFFSAPTPSSPAPSQGPPPA